MIAPSLLSVFIHNTAECSNADVYAFTGKHGDTMLGCRSCRRTVPEYVLQRHAHHAGDAEGVNHETPAPVSRGFSFKIPPAPLRPHRKGWPTHRSKGKRRNRATTTTQQETHHVR